MKKYKKFLQKVFSLMALLICLGWVINDRTTSVNAESCSECLDNRAACLQECSSQGFPAGCSSACASAYNHCAITCDDDGGGGGGNACEFGWQCISNICSNGYCAPY